MSSLLDLHPYGPRNDGQLLEELNGLCRHHWNGCPEYRRVFPDLRAASKIEDLPFLHAGTFKHVGFKTDFEGAAHQRTLMSSSTTSALSSRIALDTYSSQLQSRSAVSVLADFVGWEKRPLLVLDSSRALLRRGEVSASVAAALSLQPLSTSVTFLLKETGDPSSMNWETLAQILWENDSLIVYGFTSILFLAWGAADFPPSIASLLGKKKIHFVHSGGWKKLENLKVDAQRFDSALLGRAAPGSRVIDYYGLVEQVGVVYPLCEHGFRHVPVWSDLIVRDTYTLEPLESGPGQMQLLNVLAFGAPYHSVLTEDVGELFANPCPCGRLGKKFRLLGRLPKAEVRGCANV